MNIEDLKDLLSYLVASGIGGIAVSFLLKPYLNEKAKNLATREDIAQITDEIESVKSQYAVLIEELKARHQLRLAAVAPWIKHLTRLLNKCFHNRMVVNNINQTST